MNDTPKENEKLANAQKPDALIQGWGQVFKEIGGTGMQKHWWSKF